MLIPTVVNNFIGHMTKVQKLISELNIITATSFEPSLAWHICFLFPVWIEIMIKFCA